MMNAITGALTGRSASTATAITLTGGTVYQLSISGTIGGASIQPMLYDSTAQAWCAAGAAITAASVVNIECPNNSLLDLTITGGSGASINLTPAAIS